MLLLPIAGHSMAYSDRNASVNEAKEKDPGEWGELTGWQMIAQEVMKDLDAEHGTLHTTKGGHRGWEDGNSPYTMYQKQQDCLSGDHKAGNQATMDPHGWGELTGWQMIAQEVMKDLDAEHGTLSATEERNREGSVYPSLNIHQQQEADKCRDHKIEMQKNRIQSVVTKSGWVRRATTCHLKPNYAHFTRCKCTTFCVPKTAITIPKLSVGEVFSNDQDVSLLRQNYSNCALTMKIPCVYLPRSEKDTRRQGR